MDIVTYDLVHVLADHGMFKFCTFVGFLSFFQKFVSVMLL